VKMLKPILTTVEQGVQDGFKAGGKAMLNRSRELSPEDAGELKREGFVVVDDMTLQVGYDSFVARIQHENLDYEHDDGQAKFLEAAADQIDIETYIADGIRARFGG